MDKALVKRLYKIKLDCLDLSTRCFDMERTLPFDEPNFESEVRDRLFGVRTEINKVQNFINCKLRELEQ